MNDSKKDFTPKNQFIAYLDILGYEQLISEGGMGSKRIAEIINDSITTFRTGDKFTQRDYKAHLNFLGVDEQMQKTFAKQFEIDIKIFSDKIIMCIESDFNILVERVVKLQRHFLKHDIFVRGSISYGELYFDDNFVCGKGIITAYRLENDIAIYPRIIVDESCFKARLEIFRKDPLLFIYGIVQGEKSDDEFLWKVDSNIKNYFLKDFDDLHFLDYLEPMISNFEKLLKMDKDYANECKPYMLSFFETHKINIALQRSVAFSI